MESIARYVVQPFGEREGNQRAVNYKTGDNSKLLLGNQLEMPMKLVQINLKEKCIN
jgi:hypothetical protein